MDYYICSELERPLKIRTHKGIIDNQPDAAGPSYFRDRLYVGQRHHRIGRRFSKNHTGDRPDGCFNSFRESSVHVSELKTEILEHFVKEPECAAVGVVAD